MNTSLAHALLSDPKLTVREYRGADTVGHFSDAHREWTTLRTGCGLYDLGYRAKIALTGADRVRWLNGMVTNNIRDLVVGRGVYAFLLNPQGHILGDLIAYNSGDIITVDTDCSQVEKILATFDHYIIMDDVEVRNLSEGTTALGIGGPKSAEVLKKAGFPVPEMVALQSQVQSWSGIACTLVRSDEEQFPAYDIWIPPANVKQLWDALVEAGAAPVGSEALEMNRVVAGRPRYGVDIRERDLPQETEQTRALNFNKGCYIGQEIVERIRSRGAVHRKLTGFVTGEPVAVGSKVVANAKEVGEITSAASVLVNGIERHVALGYIRREIGIPGREVTIGEVKATVAATPVSEATLVHRDLSLEQRPA